MRFRNHCIAFLALICLAAVPVSGQDAIPAGYDLWQTIGAGATSMDFSMNPIPAGFFCARSEPYTERMTFEGVPLRTEPAGALGTTDTVLERIDEATFDKEGLARTRLRVVALSLRGREPIINGCGLWRVSVGLADKQPTTEMTFRRTTGKNGVFNADVVLNVQLSFRLDRNQKIVRTLERTVHFGEFHEAPYSIPGDSFTARAYRPDFGNGTVTRVRVLGQEAVDGEALLDFDGTQPDRQPLAGYLCGPDGCVPVQQYHQVPSHAHITLPPCGTVQPSSLEVVPAWCLGSAISEQENVAARIFRQLKAEGLVEGDPDLLAEQLLFKGVGIR